MCRIGAFAAAASDADEIFSTSYFTYNFDSNRLSHGPAPALKSDTRYSRHRAARCTLNRRPQLKQAPEACLLCAGCLSNSVHTQPGPWALCRPVRAPASSRWPASRRGQLEPCTMWARQVDAQPNVHQQCAGQLQLNRRRLKRTATRSVSSSCAAVPFACRPPTSSFTMAWCPVTSRKRFWARKAWCCGSQVLCFPGGHNRTCCMLHAVKSTGVIVCTVALTVHQPPLCRPER